MMRTQKIFYRKLHPRSPQPVLPARARMAPTRELDLPDRPPPDHRSVSSAARTSGDPRKLAGPSRSARRRPRGAAGALLAGADQRTAGALPPGADPDRIPGLDSAATSR